MQNRSSNSARAVAIGSMRDSPVFDPDSTQTVRALTRAELNDLSRHQWFVVELAVSSRPINLDMMPRLDVFAAHPLYCITQQQGTPQHSLRMGFFNDVTSAQVVCDVVRTLFPNPSVLRVSDAEQARFTKSPAPKPTVPNIASVNSRSVQPEPARSAGPKPVASPTDNKPRIPSPMSHVATAKAGSTKQKSLSAQLMDEAREIQKAKTGKHRVVEPKRSWLSRLFGARR